MWRSWDYQVPGGLLYAKQALYPLSLRDSSNIERTHPLLTGIVYDTHPSDWLDQPCQSVQYGDKMRQERQGKNVVCEIKLCKHVAGK